MHPRKKTEDKYNIAILLNLIRSEGVDIFNIFEFEKGTSKAFYGYVLHKFEIYCKPCANIVLEKFNFFSPYNQTKIVC